jgi:purine nucleoside phosphorylase
MENNNYNQPDPALDEAAAEAERASLAAHEAAVAAANSAAANSVVEEVQAVVEAPAYQAPEEVQALGSVAEGVIGATTAPKAPERKKSAKAAEVKETVALFSTKNVTWPGVGKVYRGYNIVEKDAATQWLTRSHIKPATPEEVAKEFGK